MGPGEPGGSIALSPRRLAIVAPAALALVAVSLAAAPGPDAGVGSAAPPAPASITVAVAGSPPFVRADALGGFSVEVYKAVARRLRLDGELVRYPRVADALDAVVEGRADVAVGPISITADRAQRVQFTQPYYSASIGILTAAESPSAWDRIQPFMSRAFLFGLATLILVLFLVGVVVWLAERRDNTDQFPVPFVPGVANGMWFALVTMTTVGYGDRAPITKLGRAIAGVWMVVAMITASSLTAGIATALTLSQIDGVAISSLPELAGQEVAAVRDTPGETLARRHGARLITVAGLDEGASAVLEERAVAFLYDYPVLRHHLEQSQDHELRAVESNAKSDDYGFAVALGDRRVHDLDVALLSLREEKGLERLAEDWLSRY